MAAGAGSSKARRGQSQSQSTSTSTSTLLSWVLKVAATEPFYLFHSLAFCSYFPVRASYAQSLSSDRSSHRLLRRELQATLIFLVYAAVKLVKEESWEGFIADTLFYTKGFLLAVALVIDNNLAIYYFLAFVVIYILTQQPAYDGLGDSSHLTPLQLEEILTEGNTTRFWLVEFRSLCSPSCIRASRFLPDLSVTYSNKNISFGIVDIGHFPNVAAKFGISLGVGSGQLPTYILFDHAAEVSRFPEFNFVSKGFTPTLTKNLLCRHFELDRRLIEYIHENVNHKEWSGVYKQRVGKKTVTTNVCSLHGLHFLPNHPSCSEQGSPKKKKKSE